MVWAMSDELVTKALARKVRDQLEQALLTLPLQRCGAIEVANQIEEAIDVAIELEFSRDAAMVGPDKIVRCQARRDIVRP